MLYKLSTCLVSDALKQLGVPRAAAGGCLLLPVATGMSLTLVLLAMRNANPKATHVIWPRIDQKSCYKGILTAGLTPIVVEQALVGDELCTDVVAVEAAVDAAVRSLCALPPCAATWRP